MPDLLRKVTCREGTGDFQDRMKLLKRMPLEWRSGSLCACALFLLFVALLAVAGCSHTSQNGPAQTLAATTFVSEAECTSCHADISKLCAGANHSRTLHVVNRSELGALAPPVGKIPGTCYQIAGTGDRLQFASTLGSKSELPMDLVLGSGKLGMTYVSLDRNNQALTELRMSWYPSRKSWYLTPGQESDADNDPGEHNEPEVSRSCMRCHAVTVPADGVRPEARFFGVGCQSCHGPASAHVEAARAGRFADLRIDRIGSWNATRINDLCGKCHRSASKVGTSGDEVIMTQRFQPYGLMQSPCFQKSGDTLSCITCHNPHHSGAASPSAGAAGHAAGAQATPGKICPVNPRSGCIPCHMPKRKVFPVSQIPISMADHLIWAYGKKRPH